MNTGQLKLLSLRSKKKKNVGKQAEITCGTPSSGSIYALCKSQKKKREKGVRDYLKK